MVAFGDFHGKEQERERMVALAIENGWIQKVAGWAVERGNTQPVAVLATTDCRLPPGDLGRIVRKAVKQARAMPTSMRDIQDAAGCTQYVVFSAPLDAVCELVDNVTAADLRELARRNQYAVLAFNAAAALSVAGVSREATT